MNLCLIQYKYKLEGLDNDWYEAGNRRYGRYAGLPGGDYTLRVIGSNKDGVWNEEGVSLRVKVTPPFWQTLWFWASAWLLAMGAVVGGAAWRIQAGERERRRLEGMVTQRIHELAESNQQLTIARDEATKDEAEAALDEAQAAREQAEKDPFGVALIDMSMPEMDGEMLGRAIKADLALVATRLIILPSLGLQGDTDRYAEIGFAGNLAAIEAGLPTLESEFERLRTAILGETTEE